MIRVALVGNIASGKSTAEEFLVSKNYKVLDTDKVCHNLLGADEVVNLFKDKDVFSAENIIDREKLGKLVFNDKSLKQKLEDTLYPLVRVQIDKFFDENSEEKIAFVAIPLLFEAKMENLFDKILFIYCDDKIRLSRLIARNNYTEEYAKIRMNSQMSQDEKVIKSDYIVYNNSTKENLEESLALMIKQIN